jgi:lipopolysaccharide export LptBFGC system permease protein LptF
MRGSIYLVKINSQRTVPALCLKAGGESFIFAQLRTAKKGEAPQQAGYMKQKYKKKRFLQGQKESNDPKNIDGVFIGQPEGLKNQSVVMVKKLFKVNKEAVRKLISGVSEDTVAKCLKTLKEIKKIDHLKQELKQLQQKVQLAQLHNERYDHHEKRIDQIHKKLNYPTTPPKPSKAYLNYREVPTAKHITIYRG